MLTIWFELTGLYCSINVLYWSLSCGVSTVSMNSDLGATLCSRCTIGPHSTFSYSMLNRVLLFVSKIKAILKKHKLSLYFHVALVLSFPERDDVPLPLVLSLSALSKLVSSSSYLRTIKIC